MTSQHASAWAAAAGVVAVGTGLALGELAAGLVSPSLSPVTAVGGAVIDVVPPGVKDWAVSLFGTADKVALLGGMGLVIAALAALSGVVELRRRFAGVAIIAVFGVAGLAAVLGRSELTTNAVPVPLLAAVVGMILLRWLIRRLEEWQAEAGLQAAGPGAEADALSVPAPESTAPEGNAHAGSAPKAPPPPAAASSRCSAERPPSPRSPGCSPRRSGGPPPS